VKNKVVSNVNGVLSVLGYCRAMSDLNVAFISDELASGFTAANLESGIDGTSVKATVCNNLCDENFVMTTYAVNKASVSSEKGVPECVWESCYVLIDPVDSNVTKRKLGKDKYQELELKSGHSLKPQNNTKQKNGAKSMSKRKAKKKQNKSQHFSSEEPNLDDRNYVGSVVEPHDANSHSIASSISVTECVENVAHHIVTDLPNGSACIQEMAGASCNGDEVNTVPMSVSVSQEDLFGLPDKNTCAENSDENRNVLNDDIILEKVCQEKVEVLQSDAAVAGCQDFSDLAPSSSGHIVQCSMSICPESTVAESVPSIVEENILTSEQQKKVTLRTNKRRRSQRLNPGMIINLEQQIENENQVCSESDDLSSVEREECAGTTTVQGTVRTFSSF